ncbi:MAG TPA: hypothetical protein VLG25_01165 [Patescibacteria group bacterium]|nr:hypothetical protein [Patescibacteria group bacterium]
MISFSIEPPIVVHDEEGFHKRLWDEVRYYARLDGLKKEDIHVRESYITHSTSERTSGQINVSILGWDQERSAHIVGKAVMFLVQPYERATISQATGNL